MPSHPARDPLEGGQQDQVIRGMEIAQGEGLSETGSASQLTEQCRHGAHSKPYQVVGAARRHDVGELGSQQDQEERGEKRWRNGGEHRREFTRCSTPRPQNERGPAEAGPLLCLAVSGRRD